MVVVVVNDGRLGDQRARAVLRDLGAVSGYGCHCVGFGGGAAGEGEEPLAEAAGIVRRRAVAGGALRRQKEEEEEPRERMSRWRRHFFLE